MCVFFFIAELYSLLHNELCLSGLPHCQQCLRHDVFQVLEIWPGPKRRFYDITNVLEGIGVISKLSQSVVKWR